MIRSCVHKISTRDSTEMVHNPSGGRNRQVESHCARETLQRWNRFPN